MTNQDRAHYTDHMMLYGAPLLLSSILVAASNDLTRGLAPPGGGFTLLQGTVIGSMAVSAALVIACVLGDRARPGSVPGTWFARAAQASSRVSLVLALSLAISAWWLSLP